MPEDILADATVWIRHNEAISFDRDLSVPATNANQGIRSSMSPLSRKRRANRLAEAGALRSVDK
jgi:hypothetical protein